GRRCENRSDRSHLAVRHEANAHRRHPRQHPLDDHRNPVIGREKHSPFLQKRTPAVGKRKHAAPQRPENRGKANHPPASAGQWERFKLRLPTPVSGASLAAFRVSVGLVMALEAYGLCRPYLSAVRTAATPLQAYYTGSAVEFNFPYEGFQWLPLLPPWGIHVVVGLLAFTGLTMALGFCYRASVIGVF